jgi:hypothetical protein
MNVLLQSMGVPCTESKSFCRFAQRPRHLSCASYRYSAIPWLCGPLARDTLGTDPLFIYRWTRQSANGDALVQTSRHFDDESKVASVVLGLMPPQTHRDFSLHFPQPVHSFRSTDPVFLQYSNLHFATLVTIVCYSVPSATDGSSVAEESTSAMTPHINDPQERLFGFMERFSERSRQYKT